MSPHDEAPAPPSRRRRRLIIGLAGVVGVVLVLGLTASWFLQRQLEAPRLERILNAALQPATGGVYRLRIDEVETGLFRGTLRVSGVALESDVDADHPTAAGAPVRFELSVEQFIVEGVGVLRLALLRDLHAERIEIHNAVLRVAAETPDRADQNPDPGSAGDSTAPRWTPDRIRDALSGVPRIRIGEVRIVNASLQIDTLDAGDAAGSGRSVSATDRIGRVDVTFEGLDISSTADLDHIRAAYCDDVRFHISDIRSREIGDYRLEIASIDGSSKLRALTASNVRYNPATSVAQYLEETTTSAADRIAAGVGSVSIEGFQYWRLAEDARLAVEGITLDGLDLDVLHDAKKPLPPEPPADRAVMPHALLLQLPWWIDVEAIRLSNGAITYSERVADGDRPGTIRFEDLQGTIRNVSNDPAKNTVATPTRAELEFNLNGAAATTIQIELPLLSPAPTMSVAGRIGVFEASMLNTILPPLEGIRATSGHVESVSFAIDYQGETATGSFNIRYRDLRLETENKVTGKRNLGDKILSFAANTFVVRSDNLAGPGHQPRVGRIDYAIDPQRPFFALLWEPIRQGLMKVVRR